ncbi:MAG: RNA polymerase sigma factor [Lysobacterales bacterium]
MSSPVSPGSVQGQDLEALVERIQNGDREAESELIGTYARGVRAVVRHHCRPGEPQVDDITQDILTQLLGRLRAGAIQDLQALPHYLRVSIRHACAAHYRRNGAMLAASSAEEARSQDDDPELQTHRGQLQQVIGELIAELPVERDREVLRRFYLHDQDRRRVCQALGIDEGHFHRVVHRARQRLREAMHRVGMHNLR